MNDQFRSCDRKICIVFHTTDVRIKELFYYLFNVLFACGNFTATTISGGYYFLSNEYIFKNKGRRAPLMAGMEVGSTFRSEKKGGRDLGFKYYSVRSKRSLFVKRIFR